MLKVYKNIRNRRLELNMSQQKLAELSGYTHKSAIAHIEKGEWDLSQSKLEAIAKALNVKPGELLGDTCTGMHHVSRTHSGRILRHIISGTSTVQSWQGKV